METRNPYLILGLPFGSSREEANIAFARKAKRLRRAGERGKAELTDLTWALNQIDEVIANPALALEIYRIPADPTAFHSEGVGLFSPPPERMERRTGPSTDETRALVRAWAWEILAEVVVEYGRRRRLPTV
jgi:hypothetical protein